MERQSKTYKVQHLEPSTPWLGFILLPYGEFYRPTKDLLKAKPGDILRFFQGSDYTIERVYRQVYKLMFKILTFLCVCDKLLL